MGKVALFSLNMIFLVAYKFFFGGDVYVEQVFPDQIKAGEKFEVEVSINKGEHEGFAKWQQKLPKGFNATSILSEGATFSYKDNTVKLIWMSLPEQESFVIKYLVEVDPELKGEFEISGKFSFIEANERRDVEPDTHKITVVPPSMMALASEEMEQDSTSEVEDDSLLANTEESEAPTEEERQLALTALATSGSAMGAMDSDDMNELIITQRVTNTKKVKVDRKIRSTGPGTYIVELNIDKDGLKSFGKVEEYIPEGYVASEIESNEGRFSMEDNLLKILWMSMPESSEINISYEMHSLGDELDSATVHGVFSFLRREESIQLAMKGTTFPNTFEAAAMADTESSKKVEDVAEIAVPVAVPSPAPKKEELSKEITSIPAPETDVRYRVQIAAAKKEVGKTYFEQRHGLMDEITIDYHGSWFKYMIGSYGVYKQARDRRNEIWTEDNKIDDAFVTAYNAGERISVQEALMTTKQKWYK